MHTFNPIFTTPRLAIRHARREDADFLYSLWKNPRVMGNVGFPQGLSITLEQIQNQIASHGASVYDKYLLVTLRATGETIGECKLGSPDLQGVSTTDVKLLPSFWGQGFGGEVKQGLVDYLFSHAPVLAIEADPASNNLPSIRMQEQVGGLRVSEYDSAGAHHLVYRLHRFDWERLKNELPVAPEPLRSLLAEILPDLVPGCQALALTGSFARGSENEFSDLDLYRFIEGPVEVPHRYILHPSHRLVSLTTTTICEKAADLGKPQHAMWATPGLSQMWVLFDRYGDLARLKAQATAYDPLTHREQAAAWVSEALLDNSEEVTKIISALPRVDEGAALHAMLDLDYQLNRIAAVQLGLLFETENSFFEQLRLAVPPEWTRLQRMMMGFEPAGILQRARAALGLYRYSCRWLDALILPQHRDIIEFAASLIPPEWENLG
jgi:RimJ/RimL family protein N-acetyltransferase